MNADAERPIDPNGEETSTFASPGGQITMRFGRLPLVEITFEGAVEDSVFERYLERLGDGIETAGPYCVLVDVTKAGPSRAKQRNMQAAALRAHEATIARDCKGVAFVARSALVRASLAVVMWMQRFSYPFVVVATRTEAERWLGNRMR